MTSSALLTINQGETQMYVDPATLKQDAPQVFHVFETEVEAEEFRETFGEHLNIIEEAIGWRAGHALPDKATAYLWPSRTDETGKHWLREIAATTKAALKLPRVVSPHWDTSNWIAYGTEPENLPTVLAESETIDNTDEKTDYDALVRGFELAQAMTQAEYQAELRANDIRVFENRTKYYDTEELIDRLAYYADKKPLEYEYLRESQAARLGIRASVLDRLVAERRKAKQAEKPAPAERANQKQDNNLQGSAVICRDVLPWPESVDGAAVLDGMAESLKRKVALPNGAADAIALWAAVTHCHTSFRYSPRLNITSPEKGCGKSTLRRVVALFVRRPLSIENLTTATAFRLVDKYEPTILADEYDTWLPNNEELRGFFNAGYESEAVFPRCEGDSREVRLFKAYTPIALCGIGTLSGVLSTLRDRSIVIKLSRAKPGEIQEPFDIRSVDKDRDLCRKLARWIADNRHWIAASDPNLPAGVFNRLADNWRPLFAIAQTAGGDWPKRCAEAFATLNSTDNTDAETLRVMLLSDIRDVAAAHPDDVKAGGWITSKDIIDHLTGMAERPWGEVNRGKPINERWLSVRLAAFDIKPAKLPRDGGGQKRGYNVAAFQDAFDRYLPTSGIGSGQVSQQSALRGENSETDSLDI